jgi:DNA-binding response OmpR family regulator
VTSLEFDLLYFLAKRPGHVYSREALMDQVWGEDSIVDKRSIDSLIGRVRRKLETDPAQTEAGDVHAGPVLVPVQKSRHLLARPGP